MIIQSLANKLQAKGFILLQKDEFQKEFVRVSVRHVEMSVFRVRVWSQRSRLKAQNLQFSWPIANFIKSLQIGIRPQILANGLITLQVLSSEDQIDLIIDSLQSVLQMLQYVAAQDKLDLRALQQNWGFLKFLF